MKPRLDRPQVTYTDYDAWEAEARARGLAGPYTLIGNPPGSQFVYPVRGGTAAMWNSRSAHGVIFAEYE